MDNELDVAGIGYTLNDDGLKILFEPFGEVLYAKVARFSPSGWSLGRGSVQMRTAVEAQSAFESLNGALHDGRILRISRPAH